MVKRTAAKIGAAIEDNIKRILTECETTDAAEANTESLIKFEKELADQKTWKAEMAEIAKELKESGKQKLNTSVNGRKIIRQKNETLMRRLDQLYDSDTGQQIYKLRKEKIELPFAHFKHNMNIRQLLLRGIDKAGIELNLCTIRYNLVRMITLLGVSGFEETFLTV